MTTDPANDKTTDDETTDRDASYSSPPCYQHEFATAGVTESESGTAKTGDWTSVSTWRRQQRTRLKAFREGMSDTERIRLGTAIIDAIRNELRLDSGPMAFYWPLTGEIDLRPLMRDVLNEGLALALPVIVEKDRPLEFWRWDGQSELDASGIWGIPAPAVRDPVRPSIVFVPMLGFDRVGHRLGHGGGYYDRTLAASAPMPTAIGVAYEFGRLGTVYPQGHDVPMHAIVTELGIEWHRECPYRRN